MTSLTPVNAPVTLDKYTYRVDISRVIDGDTLEIGPGGVQLGFGVSAFTTKGAPPEPTPTSKAKAVSGVITDQDLEESKHYSIRVLGINTPETRKGWWTKGLTEQQIQACIENGTKSKTRTTELVQNAKRVWFRSKTGAPDNFGRLLGDIILESPDGKLTDLGATLLKRGWLPPSRDKSDPPPSG